MSGHLTDKQREAIRSDHIFRLVLVAAYEATRGYPHDYIDAEVVRAAEDATETIRTHLHGEGSWRLRG